MIEAQEKILLLIRDVLLIIYAIISSYIILTIVFSIFPHWIEEYYPDFPQTDIKYIPLVFLLIYNYWKVKLFRKSVITMILIPITIITIFDLISLYSENSGREKEALVVTTPTGTVNSCKGIYKPKGWSDKKWNERAVVTISVPGKFILPTKGGFTTWYMLYPQCGSVKVGKKQIQPHHYENIFPDTEGGSYVFNFDKAPKDSASKIIVVYRKLP